MLLEELTKKNYGYSSKDLPPHSSKKVIVECDYCHNHIIKSNYNFIRGRLNIQKDTCKKCINRKIKDVRLENCNPNSNIYKENSIKKFISQRNPCNIGDIFGEWTVISEPFLNKSSKTHHYKVLCKCICGNKREVFESTLKNGQSKSCGCSRTSLLSPWYNTLLYKKWSGMVARCYNPNSPSFINYGGRGIKVCDQWKDNFFSFKDWALSHNYDDKLTIERINPDKDYCPENCEFITKSENSRRVRIYRRNEHLELLNKINELENKIIYLEKQLFQCNKGYV